MTNEEKYKTAKARFVAFHNFCKRQQCSECELYDVTYDTVGCAFRWLTASAEPSIAEIVAAMRKANMCITQEGWKKLCDSLDAAAKRAYEKIEDEMNKGVVYGESRLQELRSVLDETIGGCNAQEEGAK